MENTGEQLAWYRVLKTSGKKRFAMHMNENEISERRIFLRKTLAPYPRWENLSNEALNDIRLYPVTNGYIAEDAKGRQFFLQGGKVTIKETEFRRIRAMMPFEFMDAMANDFKWSKYETNIEAAKDMVNRYILRYERFKEKGMGLYIHSGTKGSGKTMLACCLINEIAKRYKGSVKFVNILDFLDMTRKGFSKENEEVLSIRQASLLVLDDIGVQMTREWVNTVLYHLVNERYANRLPVIYTSNIPIDHLGIDDRIADRIESTTFQVKLPEESIRKNIRQQEKQELLKQIEK